MWVKKDGEYLKTLAKIQLIAIIKKDMRIIF